MFFNKLFITTLDTTSLGKQLPKLNLKQLGTYSPIFTRQGIVPRTSTQSLDKRFHLEVGLEDARDVILLFSANQSQRSFQSESLSKSQV